MIFFSPKIRTALLVIIVNIQSKPISLYNVSAYQSKTFALCRTIIFKHKALYQQQDENQLTIISYICQIHFGANELVTSCEKSKLLKFMKSNCDIVYTWHALEFPQNVQVFYLVLAYRPATRTFQLALRGYSVAPLPRATSFALASRSLCPRAFRALRSQKFSKKKVCLNRLEML